MEAEIGGHQRTLFLWQHGAKIQRLALGGHEAAGEGGHKALRQKLHQRRIFRRIRHERGDAAAEVADLIGDDPDNDLTSNAYSLTKEGLGTLLLGNNNTFTGGVTVAVGQFGPNCTLGGIVTGTGCDGSLMRMGAMSPLISEEVPSGATS